MCVSLTAEDVGMIGGPMLEVNGDRLSATKIGWDDSSITFNYQKTNIPSQLA